MLRSGIYEQLIDRRLAQELDQLPENQKATAVLRVVLSRVFSHT